MKKRRGGVCSVIVLLILICGACGLLRVIDPSTPASSNPAGQRAPKVNWSTPTPLPPPSTVTPAPVATKTLLPTATAAPLSTPTPLPPTATAAPLPTATPLPPTNTPQPVSRLELVSLTSPIAPNSNARAVIGTEPGAACYIYVVYKSGPSQAEGLENKTAGNDGLCSWQWVVGPRTTPGNYDITFSVHTDGLADSQIVADFIVR